MTSSPRKNALQAFLPLFVFILILCGCKPDIDQTPVNPQKLTIAVSPAIYSGLIAVADEKGYFKEEGLDLRMDLYPSGREALEDVCRGNAQVATVADIAFSAKAVKEPCARIIASIGTTVGSQIVARGDRNIRTLADLRGKKIGFGADTVSEYFLYAFLMTEDIPLEAVTAVNIPATRQVDALINGEVDAISAFEIFAFEAKRRLGDHAVSWDTQNNLAYHWLLAVNESSINTPEPIEKLLKALTRAEAFARANSEETQNIIIRQWKFDPVFLGEAWHRTRLNVSFSQSIITSLQTFMTWHMSKEEKVAGPPDVLHYLHVDTLEAVDPRLVRIFR